MSDRPTPGVISVRIVHEPDGTFSVREVGATVDVVTVRHFMTEEAARDWISASYPEATIVDDPR
jgi:hypothetical protein